MSKETDFLGVAAAPPPALTPPPTPAPDAHRAREFLANSISGDIPPEVKWAQANADSGFGNVVWQNVTYGFGDEIDDAVVSALKGRKYGDAIEQTEFDNSEKYWKDHPRLATAGAIGGSLLAPGVGRAGKAIAAVEGAGKKLGASMLAGAGFGGLAGAGNADTDRVAGIEEGAAWGAGTAGLLHLGGNVTKAAGKWVDDLTGGRVSSEATALKDKARSLLADISGGRFGSHESAPRVPNAVRHSADRLREALRDDKVTPEQVAELQNERHVHGIPDAQLNQIGGQNVSAVFRNASSKLGEGRTEAVAAKNRARAALPRVGREAVDRFVKTDHLEMTPRLLAKHLTEEQDRLAKVDFREPYAKSISVDDRLMYLLGSPKAREAMKTAEGTEHEWVDHPEAAAQAKQIGDLRQYQTDLVKYKADLAKWEKTGGIDVSKIPKEGLDMLAASDPESTYGKSLHANIKQAFKVPEIPKPLPPTAPHFTAGALDSVRIALRDSGGSMQSSMGVTNRLDRMGKAVGGRSSEIDKYLDNVPHLQKARAVYRDLAHQREAAEFDSEILSERPADLRAMLMMGHNSKSPEVLDAMRNNLRAQVFDLLRQPGTSMTTLERLALDPDAHENMITLMGEDEANKLARAAAIRLEDFRKLRAIAPDTGSQTHSRILDNEALAFVWKHLTDPHGAVRSILTASLRAGQPMSKEEATALEALGRGNPDAIVRLMHVKPNSSLVQAMKVAYATEQGGATGRSENEANADIKQKMEDADISRERANLAKPDPDPAVPVNPTELENTPPVPASGDAPTWDPSALHVDIPVPAQ